MARSYYRKPYLDSGVFIAWIKGEVVTEKAYEEGRRQLAAAGVQLSYKTVDAAREAAKKVSASE